MVHGRAFSEGVPLGVRLAARYGGTRRRSMRRVVVLQESTEPRPTRDSPVAASRTLDGEEQPVAQALMAAFVMIGLDEFVNDVPERAFANEDQLIETGFLDRPHQAFRVGIEIGRTGRRADGFDAGR